MAAVDGGAVAGPDGGRVMRRLVAPAGTTCASIALALMVGGSISAAVAQSANYPTMAPIASYQMERSAEIALARSAAPASISDNATVLVLGPRGYETAVTGTNGFVCIVSRSWMAPVDWPEFWSPKIRAADCMNPQAARTLVPVITLRSRMVLAGHSTAEILAAIRTAFKEGKVPALARGAMSYMMSPTAYLTDEGNHNMPHLMFLVDGIDVQDWGSGALLSPIMSAPYWFFSATETAQSHGLPSIQVFLVEVMQWADGTVARH
jgi:hypothetical protein